MARRPITPLSNVIALPEPEKKPLPAPLEVDIGNGESPVSMENGVKKTELPDGGLEIDLNPQFNDKPNSEKFDANLALELSDSELNSISTEVLEGIQRDIDSRREHLEMLAEGMKLLGLVLESGTSAVGSTSAPMEGMSTVRHPLLLDACQNFQATTSGELLPASGPVKIRDDKPLPPDNPMMGHNGGPPLNPLANPAAPPMPPQAGAPPIPPQAPSPMAAPQGGPAPMPPNAVPPLQPGAAPPMPVPPPMAPVEPPRDELADALEKDFNHYLTVTDQNYYPDTDQMLFKIGFGGLGIKKIYHNPIKRRPVSESVDIEDFIVSNALASLDNATRITHRMNMRPSTLKRMQLLGVYRNVMIGEPTQSEETDSITQAKANIAGVQPQVQDPRDADHVLYECYTELLLPEDKKVPKEFRDGGLHVPYRVTIERDSQKVLEIRRNWKESDEQCMPREFFVDFPYIRAFGFYCIGLLHILGNTTKTLTAAWRELIDSGMFANFPGFLFLKGAGRQLTNTFRVPPGGGVGLDSTATDIKSAVMPLPYKDLGPAFTAFIQHVEELGAKLGGTANMSVGEGKQDAPVGTTLALIEQATRPIGAVQKRLHQAQAKEFQLLKERFKEDPEAFWRFNRKPAKTWEKAQFIAALNEYDLVPVSDPNNPTQMHRAAKAEALKQVATQAPGLLDPWKTFLRWAKEMKITDVDDLKADAPSTQQPPVDPAKMADVQHKNAKLAADQQTTAAKSQTDLQIKQMELQDKAAERQNKLEVAQIGEQTERLRLASTIAIHSSNIDDAQKALNLKIMSEHVGKAQGQQHELKKGDIAHQRAQELAAQQQEQQPPEAAE